MAEKDRSFKKNLLGHANEFRSICEVLREIYWATKDPSIRLKAIEASRMAKKMSVKLAQDKYNMPEGMEYEKMSEEDRKNVSKERWEKYKEELEKGIDHPMKPEDKMSEFKILETPTFKYKLYSEQTFWVKNLKAFGIFQGGGQPYIKNYVKDYSLALDIGANIGMNSMLYSIRFNKVIGFEPQSKIYNQALDNIKLNGIKNCVLHNVGLGATNEIKGITNKRRSMNNDGKAYITEVASGFETVNIRTLDSYNLAPSFIKSDTEGFEMAVLKGGIETLKKHRPVVLVEINHTLKRYGGTAGELFEFMKSIGYSHHSAGVESSIFIYGDV